MANDFHRFAVESGRSPRSAACAFVGLGVLALTSTFGASATGALATGASATPIVSGAQKANADSAPTMVMASMYSSHNQHSGVMTTRSGRISQRAAGRIAMRYLGARRVVRFEGVRNGAYIVHLDKGGRRHHVLVGTRTGRVIKSYRYIRDSIDFR